MFGFFKRRPPEPALDLSQYVPFKSPEAAFQYACQFHHDEIHEQSGHVALVLDSREVAGTEAAVKVRDDGIQLATLRVANSDGGFVVLAQTAIKNAPPLKPGDLVLWVAGKYLSEFGAQLPDKRSGWVGLIYGTLAPEMRMDTGQFRVSLNYHDLAT